jgi:hypothetical protein
MTRRAARWLGAVLALSVVPGCGLGAAAKGDFAAKYACPTSQLAVREDRGFQVVTGCGRESRYICASEENGSEVLCSESVWIVYEASDGTHRETWADGDPALANETALATAAHDLSCPRSSVALAGGSMLIGGETKIIDGCGQRLTYQTVRYEVPPDPHRAGQVQGRRFMLTGRLALPPQ